MLRGESTIDLRRFDPPPISRVYLDREVEPNAKAIEAILSADAIVLGPGDVYTSIVPNLLVNGIADAIHQSAAKTIYVCNVMTKHGETDDFTPPDFLRAISTYLGDRPIDVALMNSDPIPADIQELYSGVKARPVTVTEGIAGQMSEWSRMQRCASLSQVLIPAGEDELRVRHDPTKLASEILNVLETSESGETGELNTESGNNTPQYAD